MKQIAFVTYTGKPELTHSERLTRDVLETRDAQVSAVVWNQADVDWTAFDIVVLRSSWDYHKHAEQFRAWLNGLEAGGVNLWNHPDTVRWNMQKSYLQELGEQGVRIPRSHFVPRGSDARLDEFVAPDWPGAVLKPVVSAAADDTFRFAKDEAEEHQAALETILAEKDAIIQEFMPEVQTEGEWSLIFIAGQFSHAVLKRPGEGDFRVQIHLGGGQVSATPPNTLVEQARAILDHVPQDLLYARIDGVDREGTFILMELELIEPYLFLEYGEGAPQRFAEAILRVC